MKKFDRLPPQQRKEEIQAAALKLFQEKGFAATTMENIVSAVTLSKGGVYRLYGSTVEILSDLILSGMRLRNAYYEQRVREEMEQGRPLTGSFFVEIIGDSLLLYPEFSAVYVEFLWEKQRNLQLEALYQEICRTSVAETVALIQKYGAGDLFLENGCTLEKLTELMNIAILGLQVLHLRDTFQENRRQIYEELARIIKINECFKGEK